MRTVPARRSPTWMIGLVLAACIGGGRAAQAGAANLAPIDSENLFGFITGTDVGEAGEKELESETTARLGRRTGTYAALAQSLGLEYSPNDRTRLEPTVFLGAHDISGVADLDDVRQLGFQGLSFEMRYKLLDRHADGIGLTLRAEPEWSRIDETTGQPADQYGSDLALLVDKELLSDRIIAAFNLLYEPQATRDRAIGAWSHDATLGVGAGLMAQTSRNVFVGGELRYLRAYDSLGVADFAGDAVFLGPTLFFKPTEAWRITAAWSMQVAGKAAHAPGALDLSDFERHQVKLRIAYEF
ncbi:MAG TPA: hypothetical protein VLX44_12540 [Xanthobacteraceae bacterium]|nr:hypothetical protein [Xanthobacteraceae bacterium]